MAEEKKLIEEKRLITVNIGNTYDWETQVRVLELGEPGYNTDTGELKIGDGQHLFAGLPPLIHGGFTSIEIVTE